MEPMAKTVISSGENSRLPVLVSNGFGYIPFSYKKSYKQRKTTAKAVVFMVAGARLDRCLTGRFPFGGSAARFAVPGVRLAYSEAALHTDRYTQNACTASATGGVQAF